MKALNRPLRISSANLLMDLTLIAGYYTFLDVLILWQTEHLVWAGIIMMVLHIAVAAFGLFTFFSIYTMEHALKKYRSMFSDMEGAVIGISAMISFVAGFWWLVPHQAIKATGGLQIYNGLTMLIYFIVCLLAMGKALEDTRYYTFSRSSTASVLSAILEGSYFFFSYALLKATMQVWQPEEMYYRFLAILCLVLFYLPFRIFLLLRPPFHPIELCTLLLAFGLMLAGLFN